MRLLIVGSNPLSLFFSALFSESSEVILLDERKHYMSIREENELTLKLKGKDLIFNVDALVSNSMDLIGEQFNIMILSGNAYDVHYSSLRMLENDIFANLIILASDGLGLEDELEKAVRKEQVIGRILTDMQVVFKKDSNEIEVTRFEPIYMGYSYKKGKEKLLEKLEDKIKELGFNVNFLSDIKSIIWTRAIIKSSVEALAEILDVKLKFLLESIEVREILQKLLKESYLIARKNGIELFNLYREALRYVNRFGERKSVFSGDYMSSLELPFLNGFLVNIGAKLGINTVYNELIFKLVKSRIEAKKFK